MNNSICYSISYFVEAVLLWQYCSVLFLTKYKTKYRLVMLILLYMILFGVSMLQWKSLNIFLYLCFNFIFLLTQYRIKWYGAFFHAAILTTVMGICEVIVYSIEYRVTSPEETVYNLFILTVFSKMMLVVIIYVLMCVLKKEHRKLQCRDASVLMLIYIPLVSIFFMHTFVCMSESYVLSSKISIMIIVASICLLSVNLLVFGIEQYNEKKNFEFMEVQLLLQKEGYRREYYEMLQSQNENQRILIHDIKKHLESIRILNEHKEYEKVEAYIQQILYSSELKETVRFCNHDILNSILGRYMRKCETKNINFYVDIRKETIDFITDRDITSLFCNLLDNAVEAADTLPEAFIELYIGKSEKASCVVLTMINSCKEKPCIKADNILLTHKADKYKHGLGMKSIRKTITRYNGEMKMYYEEDTKTFHTIICLRPADGYLTNAEDFGMLN